MAESGRERRSAPRLPERLSAPPILENDMQPAAPPKTKTAPKPR
jgi:hypothetical protein